MKPKGAIHNSTLSWLKTPINKPTQQLLKQAAHISKAFDAPDNTVQPEFIFAAILQSTSGVCKAFASFLRDDAPGLKAGFLSALGNIYEQTLPEISHRLQTSYAPKNPLYSNDCKAIIRTAARNWKKHHANRPVPIDYVLAAILNYKKPLSVLDEALLDFDIDREEMSEFLTVISPHFQFQPKPSNPPTTQTVASSNHAEISATLRTVEAHLSTHIIGQPAATSVIINALKNNSLGLKHPSQPIGVFIFAGFTGVGKTEFCKQLSTILGLPFLRLDMSEYAEKHTVSRLYGSPPGYIGYERGGQLTNFVSRHPASVIVFDEIEKAHPDISDVLLQITEEGTLTDSKGKIVSLRETIVILTTNLGAREVAYQPAGFVTHASKDTGAFHKAIKKHFKPELLGRIGPNRIVIFNQLNPDQFHSVAQLELDKINHRLTHTHNVKVHFTPSVTSQIIATSKTDLYGARNLHRTIEQTILPALSNFLLENDPTNIDTISVSYHPDSSYSFHAVKQ